MSKAKAPEMLPPSEEHIQIEHPSHVLRLLRLIREGTPSHASRASALLGHYAASCSSGAAITDETLKDTKPAAVKSDEIPLQQHPSLVIWDLIGRLVAGDGKSNRKKGDAESSSSGLFDFHWETRTNCALALEAVAQCLPVEDRRHFFESDHIATDDYNGSFMWLSVQDLRAKLDECETEDKTKTPNENNEDSNNAPQDQMDLVLERGRLLLASSGERYDWTCVDEEAQAYARENQALQALDGTATKSRSNADQDTLNDDGQHSFLKRRVMLQRQILAKRIGLGGILSSSIVNLGGISTDQDILKDEEFVSDLTSPTISSVKKRKAAKQLGKKVEGAKKRKRKSRKTEPDDDEFLPNIDIRQLLIAESSKTDTVNDLNFKLHQSRHRNPQLLLSTEVAFRTFDPQWTVRHGALLATLSLLRAWRVHTLPHSSAKDKIFFGKWPQDILARCICIIGLDRFADFSGVHIGSAEKLHDTISGAVVAPVREMAAQIIAILLEAAPPEVWESTFDLLFQLFDRRRVNNRDGWEVRHGVLLVWKYVCALAGLRFGSSTECCIVHPTFRPLTIRSASSSCFNKHLTTFDGIAKLSAQGISDESDDVRAVSAQVLLQMLKNDWKYFTVDIVKEYSSSIWGALQNTRNDVSSSAADLLILFACLLSRDFYATTQSLRVNNSESDKGIMSTVLGKLASFIRFDSEVVSISCFQAISLVTRSITDEDHKNLSSSTTARIMCDIAEQLFCHICECSPDVLMADTVAKHRDEAWGCVLDALSDLIKKAHFDEECQKRIYDAAVTMTLRYFGISSERIMRSSETSIELAFRGIEEGDGLVRDMTWGADARFFMSKFTSSRALVQFYKKACPDKLYSIAPLAIQTCLQSPWSDQCEASCLLFIAIAAVDYNVDVGCLFDFKGVMIKLDNIVSETPLCVLIEGSSLGSALVSDRKVQSLCDNTFSAALTSAIRSHGDMNHNALSNNVVALWTSVFEERGVCCMALRKSNQPLTTKSFVRLNASIAGAVVHKKELPKKITPVVQALMTSLKSEDCEHRAKQTCSYIARMMTMIPNDSPHNKARTKLLENIFSLASDRYTTPAPPLTSIWARHTLELLVARLSSAMQQLPVLWDKLSLLKDPAFLTLSEQQQFDSALMLSIVTASIKESEINVPFAESAVHAACNSQSTCVRNQATESILNLCNSAFVAMMDVIMNCLLPILANIENDNERVGGCELLLTVLQKFNVSTAPYVITLLPVVMRLMTDVSEQCSRHAASAFAILVRIAPLSANCIDQSVSSSKVSQVVQHLILGMPLPPCELPSSIERALNESGTTLRPYQMEGISWMRFLSEVHLNGALCDDMGLGKTLQSLVAVALSHSSKSDGSAYPKRSLVVCPSTVVGHWVGEIRRFFPGNQVLSPFEYTGSVRARRKSWDVEARKHNIVVTSYSILRTDIELLELPIWDYCILDEGHLLKNPKTITAKASRRIKSRNKLILTGTPIQNHVHEIWATFDFLMPNFLGTESCFAKEFAKPIISGQKLEASATDAKRSIECLKLLHQQVLPFVLRREKSQVMKELPPKIITDIPCTLSSQQQTFYRKVMELTQTKAALDVVDESIKNFDDQAYSCEPQKLGSHVLTSLLHLRLICTHPLLYSLVGSKKQGSMPLSMTRLDSSGKLMALNDLLRHSGVAESDIMAADNDSSGFMLYTDDDYGEPDSGILLNEDCNKDDLGLDTDKDKSPQGVGSKCLIFAQFTQSLDIVQKFLFEPHMPSLEYLRLDGSVPSSQRDKVVDQFNEDDSIKVLLLTTKIGGLGLNLTGADMVIFLEPDWNPFIDLQAMDRAHRIGQSRTVNVYRLITTDTIEEKILKVQQRKRATADAVVNTDNSTMYSMGTDKLLDIFTFRGAANSDESGGGDNALSYLDDSNPNEYEALSVDGFLRGMK